MNTLNFDTQPRAATVSLFTLSVIALALYALAVPTVLSGTSIFSNVGLLEAVELVGLFAAVAIATFSFKSKFARNATPPVPISNQMPAAEGLNFQPDQSAGDDVNLDSEQRFSLVLRTFDIATFYCDLEHRYTWSHNFLGSPDDLIGKTDSEIMPRDAANILLDLKKKALKDGGMHDGELSFDIGTETRTYAVQVAPRRDKIGNIIGTMAVSCDVTEKAIWQKHLVMMMREVNHRARNLLAIVVSICGQTARSALDVEEYKDKITGRVMSLAGSMDLLTKDNWVASSLKKLLNVQLSILPNNSMKRVNIHGADVLVNSNVVQSIGLAVHELATNASNHGALSHKKGRVDVTIATENSCDGAKLVLTWREKSPLQVSASNVNGFGFMTLNKIVATELNGSSQFLWHPDGIEYKLTMPGDVIGVDPTLDQASGAEKQEEPQSMRESLTGEVIYLTR